MIAPSARMKSPALKTGPKLRKLRFLMTGNIILGHPPAFPYAPRNCNLHADSRYFAANFSDSFSIW